MRKDTDMEIFHVLGEGHNLRALSIMPRQFNLLVSAWTYHHSKAMREHKQLIREKAGILLVDSGFLSAAVAKCPEWANEQDLVLQCADELKADRVIMMDIPCAPNILELSGLTAEQAMQLTYRNAENFNRYQITAAKGFVNQGWTFAERDECHRVYMELGINPDWWAVGSVAKRTPETGLFEHVRHVRNLVDGHLHCLGIGHAAWVRRLCELGVNSCDSAVAALTNAYGKAIANGRQQSLAPKGEVLSRNAEMHCMLYIYNMMAVEHDAQVVKAAPMSTNIQGRFEFA